MLRNDAAANVVTDPVGSPNLLARKWNGAVSGSRRWRSDSMKLRSSTMGTLWVRRYWRSRPASTNSAQLTRLVPVASSRMIGL